jgi:hypothetical protein
MRRISPPVKVSVRRNGFRVRTIARLKFEAGPQIVGWVNYNNKVYPLFEGPGGELFLNEDGWASTRHYPLTRADDDYRSWKPGGGFRF